VERRNLVVWKPTSARGTEFYNVYKVLALQKYFLGSVNFGELTAFTDTSSRPRQQSDRYVITVVDTCGNESFYSTSHKTMHLTANKGAADEINLIWEHYEGLPVDWYYVFRGTDSTAMTLLDSISYDPTKTQYTDENAPTDHKVYYQIGIKLSEVILLSGGKKAGSGPYSHSLSNLEDNRLQSTIGIKDLIAGTLKVYPNPFTDLATIQFENPANKPYQFTIRDISGKLVRSSQLVTGSEFELHRGDLMAGYYFVELRGDNIYRGKVVIE